MIYQHQDTKSLEKFINCKGAGSLSNPFTDSINGYKLHKLAVCYHGYGSLLEFNNVLRYYLKGENGKISKEYFDLHKGPTFSKQQIQSTKFLKSTEFDSDDDGDDGEGGRKEKNRNKNQQQVISQMKPNISKKKKDIFDAVWNHEKYPIEDYLDHLWIAYYDNRVEIYQRISHTKYLYRVQNAVFQLAEAAEKNKTKKNVKTKTRKDNSFEGVHGTCVFSRLRSFNFENFVWDPFHALSNVIGYFMELLRGDRIINMNWRKLNVLQNVFPKLQFAKSDPDWIVSDKHQLLFDTILNSILVPSGVFKAKNDYALKYPFRQLSYLKGHDKIVLLTVYFKFMVSFFNEMPKAYKNFFSQFADDINEMLNPIIECSKMDNLCAKFHETLTLHDCLFPDSEKPHCLMQLLDIVHFLKKGGPIRSHWCLFGERALGKISNSLPKGGTNYMKTLFNRCIAKENSLSELNVSEKLKQLTQGFVFNNFDSDLFALQLKKTNNFFKKDDFMDDFKDDLLLFVVKYLNTECIENLIVKSNLYRLHYVYDNSEKVDRKDETTNSFCKWIDVLYNNYTMFGGQTCFRLDEMVNIDPKKQRNYDDRMILDWASNGGIYLDDFEGIIKDIFIFQTPMIVNEAIVKGWLLVAIIISFGFVIILCFMLGVHLKCRGKEFCYDKSAEFLRNHWHIQSHNSCWIKFKRSYLTNIHTGPKNNRQHTEENQLKSNIEFGQMNFIVFLNMPKDKLVHMLPFAHVNYPRVMKPDNTKVGGCHWSLDLIGNNFISTSCFICLTSILSTNISTSAFNTNSFPLAKNTSFASNRKRTVMTKADGAKEYVLENKTPSNVMCSKIFFLETTPFRENIMYPSIEKREIIPNNCKNSDCIVIYI
jgi:hypothetical protein